MMSIAQAPHGMNVVVETEGTVIIGRLGKLEGDRVNMHHVAIFRVAAGENPEPIIQHTAKFGVPVEHRDLSFEAQAVRRVRLLGQVQKA